VPDLGHLLNHTTGVIDSSVKMEKTARRTALQEAAKLTRRSDDNVWQLEPLSLNPNQKKKLSYRRVTARCVLSVVILPITTQQCRNYLYDKS